MAGVTFSHSRGPRPGNFHWEGRYDVMAPKATKSSGTKGAAHRSGDQGLGRAKAKAARRAMSIRIAPVEV
jgi:hypothetical protein